MPDTAELVYFDGDSPADYRDTVAMKWQVHYEGGVSQFDYFNALQRFTAIEGMPQRRQKYVSTETLNVGVNIYALHHHGVMRDPKDAKSLWDWTVTFGPPPIGAPIAEDGGGDNNGEPDQDQNSYSGSPVNWGPEFNVEYYDTELPVLKARLIGNALPRANRSIGSDGPIVNAVGQQPSDPAYRTARLPVFVIRKNYPSLAAIVAQNETYAGATNNADLQGVTAFRMEHLLTESLGRTVDNGSVYWPGVTRILIHRSADDADILVDNVGLKFWNGSRLVNATDDDGQVTGEPIPLKFDGTKATTASTIRYQHLNPLDLSPLFAPYAAS